MVPWLPWFMVPGNLVWGPGWGGWGGRGGRGGWGGWGGWVG